MRQEIERVAPLLDIEVSRSGDGRTVTAYASAFDVAYEVRDFDGHYDEVVDRSAFNRTIGRGVSGVKVVYNHGRTIWQTPSERYSMPLGTPVEIRAEPAGLLTVTRYAKTPLADEVLELIREGAITTQSFRGPIIRSARPVPGANGRPVIRRLELGLKEYGPTLFPANQDAQILAVRASVLAEQVGQMSEEEREELLALLSEPPVEVSSAASEPLTEPVTDPPQDPSLTPLEGPSAEVLLAANANRRRR